MSTRLRPDARVLVRVPSWLGDVVMTEPVLRALLAEVGELTIAGPGRLVQWLADMRPGLHPVGAKDLDAWRGHDVCLLLTNSLRSATMAARAGIPERVGWARDARGWLLTQGPRPTREVGRPPLGIGRPRAWPRVLPRSIGAASVELVGVLGVPVRDARPRLRVVASGSTAAEARLAGLGLAPDAAFLLVNVGGRVGSAKAYPAASWIRTLRALRTATELPLLVVCGPGEEVRMTEVAAAGVPDVHACDPVPDLAELLALCERARVLVTADSGPRHLAVAVDTPVAVVCGPTDPRHTADHLAETRIVREPVECGPCHRERCPLDGDERDACMLGVDPAALAGAALELLG